MPLNKAAKRVIDIGLRLAISAGMLGFLLWRVQPSRVLAQMGNFNPWWVVVALILALTGFTTAGLRWFVYMRAHGLKVNLKQTMAGMFAGLFLGNFLPAGAGVDVIRGAWVHRQTGELAKLTASVVMDRLSGVIVLTLIALAAIWTRSNMRLPVAILGALLVLGTAFAFTPAFLRFTENTVGRVKWFNAGQRMMAVFKAFNFYGSKPKALLLGFAITVLLQTIFGFVAMAVALSLGFKAPLWSYIILIPTINLLAMLPFSIGGIGVREAGFVFFFAPWIPEPGCVALSLIYYATTVLPSLVGIIPIWTRRKKKTKD